MEEWYEKESEEKKGLRKGRAMVMVWVLGY